MYDGKIGDVEFRLARSGDRPLLSLGQDQKEPGTPGAVGSIVIDSLHHGPGPDHAGLDPRKYADSDGVWALSPGTLLPAGLKTPNFGEQGPCEHTYGVASMVPHGGDAILILPNILRRVLSNLTELDDLTPTAGNILTGGWAYWGGLYFLGLATSSNGYSSGFVRGTLGAWTEVLSSTFGGSYFLTHRGQLWKAQNTAAGVVIHRTDVAFPNNPHDWVLVGNIATDATSGMMPMGSRVGIVLRSGRIVTTDEDMTGLTEVFHDGSQSAPTANDFGHGATQWQNQIIVPGVTGLYAIEPGQPARDISPATVQGRLISTIKTDVGWQPGAILPWGPFLFVGTRGTNPQVLVLFPYGDDGLHYNVIGRYAGTPGAIRGLCMVEPADGYLKLLVLEGNSTSSALYAQHLPLRMEFSLAPSSIMQSSSDFKTAYYGGDEAAHNVTKWFQTLQGMALNMGLNDTWTFWATVDEGTEFLLGYIHKNSASADDPNPQKFSLNFPTLTLGRRVRLRIAWSTASPTGRTTWPNLTLPLNLDFFYEPDPSDHIQLIIDSGDVQGRIGVQSRTLDQLLTALQGYRGSSKVLKLYQNNTEWTVFVEKAEMTKIDGDTGRRGDREAITMTVRRV